MPIIHTTDLVALWSDVVGCSVVVVDGLTVLVRCLEVVVCSSVVVAGELM